MPGCTVDIPRRSIRPRRRRGHRLSDPSARGRPWSTRRTCARSTRCGELRTPGAFLERLAERVRLIVFNPRGTGLSDRPRPSRWNLGWMTSMRCWMRRGSSRASLFGVAESANACALFASTYPERCRNLILHWPYAMMDVERGDEERGWIREMPRALGRTRLDGGVRATRSAPPIATIPSLMDWFVWMQRAAASPSAAAEFTRMQMDTDIGDVLPTIRVPTLIVYPSGEGDAARRLAERIPDATSWSSRARAGPVHRRRPTHGPDDPRRASRTRCRSSSESVLATLLFTDLTDSTVMAADARR